MTEFFDTIRHEEAQSDNPLALRWYHADRVVLGGTMADHR
jgi:xylose isomerase